MRRVNLIFRVRAPAALVVAGLAGVFVAALPRAAAAAHTTNAATRAVLPDLRQLPPYDLEVRRVGRRTVLAFASAAANVGKGPLLVQGARHRGTRVMRADQIVRRADGTSFLRRGIGTIRFVPGGHSHWHFADFQRFELRSASTGRRVARDHKTGFCLGDRFLMNPRAPKPPQPGINHNCSKKLPGTLRILMGITPGFGDDYAPYLEDQWVDITRVRPGRYVLVHRADPGKRLTVANRGDDVASALIVLRAGRRGGLPTVRVLARCARSDGSRARPCPARR